MRTVFQYVCCSQCHSLFPWRILQMSQCCVNWLNANFSRQTYFFFFPPPLPLFPCSLCLSHFTPPHHYLSPFLPFFNNKYHKALFCSRHHDRFGVNKHECHIVLFLMVLLPGQQDRQLSKYVEGKYQGTVLKRSYSRSKWYFRERQETR